MTYFVTFVPDFVTFVPYFMTFVPDLCDLCAFLYDLCGKKIYTPVPTMRESLLKIKHKITQWSIFKQIIL